MNTIAHYSMPKHVDWANIRKLYDMPPSNYEEFLSIKGVGPSTVRALTLIAELIFGTNLRGKILRNILLPMEERMVFPILLTEKL